MSDKSAFRKAWEILDALERRNALIVLAVMIVSAFAAAGMVGSIFPFLSVLSDPDLIRRNSLLASAYEWGGFTSDFDFVVVLGLCSIGVIVLSSVMLLVNTWAVTRFTQMRMHTISHRLLAHYLAQPYEFFLSRHSGDMSTNILSEAERAVREFIYPAMTLISSLLTILSVVAILMIANPLVAALALGIFGTIYLAAVLFTRRIVNRLGQERAAANSERFRIAGEALGGVKDIKLLGREAAYVDRYGEPSIVAARTQGRVALFAQGPRFIIQMIGFGGMIVLALALLDPAQFGQRDALAGLLPLLGLLAFAGQRLLPELQAAYNSLTILNAGSASLERVHADLTSTPCRRFDRATPTPMRLTRDLVLDKVTYAYPGARRPGLDGLSATIWAGERIGVIGPSGAGKTTLADIVLGLIEPQSGRLMVDGTALGTYNMRGWQRAIGYVPQDIFLTDASLSENIALGLRPEEIDPGRVERAARSAMLHEFVMTELPDGYATRIGERGVRLSGGQRQRIGIARALYHDADLILFDEATSALDNLTEAEVMAAIQQLPGDKTVVIIAHRLSTVRHCDKILVLERGCLAGAGTWEDLATQNATFRALAQISEQVPVAT
jgi:ABC-type multidrug transport system fused ATPase/permease subunit